MEKTETTQSPGLEKVKSNAQIKFEASISTAIELKEQANAIVITNEDTLLQANQILSKMNKHLKETKAKGLALRKPYNDAAAIIIDFEKLVTGPLDEGLKIGKDKLKSWNDAEAERARLAQAAIEKKKTLFNDLILQIKVKYDACSTADMCSKLSDSITEKWPNNEFFGPYAEEANAEKKRYLELLSIKSRALSSDLNSTAIATLKKAEEQAAIKTAENKEAVAEKQSELNQTVASDIYKSNTRKTPKYEIIDVTKIPLQWMTPDLDKIKAHLTSIKDSLDAPVEFNGVKFFIENTVVIR